MGLWALGEVEVEVEVEVQSVGADADVRDISKLGKPASSRRDCELGVGCWVKGSNNPIRRGEGHRCLMLPKRKWA